MKKFLLTIITYSLAATVSIAQNKEWNANPFRHISISAGAGTAGIDFELATTLGNHLQLRAGVSALPFTYSGEFELDNFDMMETIDASPNASKIKYELNTQGINIQNLPTEAELDAELGLLNGKLLLDYYPFKKSTFRITAGVYFGKEKLINVEGAMPEEIIKTTQIMNKYLPEDEQFASGITIGDQLIEADELGNVDAFIKINKIKPYLGIGFGRAVPKNRIGFNMDIGVMYHGTPKIDSSNGKIAEAMNDELENSGVIDILDDIKVYPVVSFRLVARIF